MEWFMIVTAGVMISAGLFSMLKEGLVQIITGIMLMGHGANLMVFISGGLSEGAPVFANSDGLVSKASADPLPQALALTAIVIGFGITAFTLMLFQHMKIKLGSAKTGDILHRVEDP